MNKFSFITHLKRRTIVHGNAYIVEDHSNMTVDWICGLVSDYTSNSQTDQVSTTAQGRHIICEC